MEKTHLVVEGGRGHFRAHGSQAPLRLRQQGRYEVVRPPITGCKQHHRTGLPSLRMHGSRSIKTERVTK